MIKKPDKHDQVVFEIMKYFIKVEKKIKHNEHQLLEALMTYFMCYLCQVADTEEEVFDYLNNIIKHFPSLFKATKIMEKFNN